MTGSTHTLPYTSPGPLRLPPGSLETVEEGDSEPEDDNLSQYSASSSVGLSNIEEEEDDLGEGSIQERDAVFEKIKESLSRTIQRSGSVVSAISTLSAESDGPHVQISEQYTSIPYGIQPRATYEHSKLQADIMGVAYNGRMRQFIILDSKGITTWKRDIVEPRVRRALQYPKYEYRLIVNIVYAPKYNCYFALSKDFSLKVLNRDFEETCSVSADLRSVLFMLFNPVKDELITGGVGGIKVWDFCQKAGRAFQELKPLANYILEEKYTLPNVGGSWVKRVDLDHYLQHLYCCSDTDLHVYDLQGTLLFKLERAHTMSITGCCFSPSAKVLVTSSVDSEVKVWSLMGGLVHTFRGHSRAVTAMLLHPDTSNIVITCSLDGSVRMWSLDIMDLLYMIVVSTDGVLWMGLTDDRLMYISTCRNITLWSLNQFYRFWSLARNPVTKLSLASCSSKPTTRVVAVGEDSSVRMFARSNQKNITTVLPPPDISALQKVLSVCYSREFNLAFLLITSKEIWVYTTRTDPSCRISTLDVHELQLPYLSGKTEGGGPGVHKPAPSAASLGPGGVTHRATENGHGNEELSNCSSLCILNSAAMMWTDEGFGCPLRHSYLLLGLEDGRILFMDPVVKGRKHMEFKASKDAIKEMRQDTIHGCLMTLVQLKELVLIQIWGLPQLDALYEVYCAQDVNDFARLGLSFLTGHQSGHLNFHFLEPAEDTGISKPKLEPNYEDVVDTSRRPEHGGPVVAMDTVGGNLRIFCTCSSDGAIKIWDENKFLMTEVMLDESLSAACFLDETGDLLVGFKNHIFYIDHSKLCPNLRTPEFEMETSDLESEVYEDPTVLYEGLTPSQDPVTLDNYLVPYDIKFDKDFLEGKTKIEHKLAKPEESESETESDMSMAPSQVYRSPPESPGSLSMIDLTLGADYSQYDLYKQMESTLDHMGRGGRKRRKHVMIETPDITDRDEEDKEVEKFILPSFGFSPGPSPSITPPSGQASPRHLVFEELPPDSDDESSVRERPKGIRPIEPAEAEVHQHTWSPEVSFRPMTLTPSPPQSPTNKLSTVLTHSKSPVESHDNNAQRMVLVTELKKPLNPSPQNTVLSQKVPSETTDSPDAVTITTINLAEGDSEKTEKTGIHAVSGEAGDVEGEDEESQSSRVKGMKVDVRGLMKDKKIRRVTSGRAPSMTRRSSAEHIHEAHGHDRHDDKRSRRELKKKQQLQDRKLPPGHQPLDKAKLLLLPPNPPSMLTRKKSMSQDQRNLELHLLHHPDLHREHDGLLNAENSMAHIKFDESKDMDKLQEQMWHAEASVHGKPLTLPPPKASSHARATVPKIEIKTDAKNQPVNRTLMFGEDGQIEGHIPGVGSSPTAELEDSGDEGGARRNKEGEEQGQSQGTTDSGYRNLDSVPPETQMERTRDADHHVDSNKWFSEGQEEAPIKVKPVRRSCQLTVHLPQPGIETPSQEASSSYRGTPDSGLDEALAAVQSPVTPVPPTVPSPTEVEEEEDPDEMIISEEDKNRAIQRPATSFTGLRRGQLEGERLKAERPHTAHVRFRAELEFIVELPEQLEELQTAFQEAMERYQHLQPPRVGMSGDKLYKNDGVNFDENWSERIIERHLLLRLQKEIRAQSAAQKRQALESMQQDRRTRQWARSSDSGVGISESSIFSGDKRAKSSLSVPNIAIARPPTRETSRPKTAHANLQRQQISSIKSELSHEKAYRCRMTPESQKTSRPSSSRSVSSVADFSPHWIDPRNPSAWRPKSSKSIPSKCNRYVLVNKPKDKNAPPVPSPLEEQLLAERFPKMGRKVIQSMSAPDNTPRAASQKSAREVEYSPFVYQRFF